jgi:hypothetical protein
MKISAIFLSLLFVPVCAAAADSSPAASNAPAEMAKLSPRIGTWQVTIRSMPGAGSPQGGLDKGVATIKQGPGGFSIVQDFWSRGSSGHQVGQSYTWWDTPTKSYKSVWCDNMQGCTEFTTAVDGASWTTEFDGVADGKKIRTTVHATMSPDHNCIHEEAASSSDGGPPQTVTVSEYQRVLAGGAQEKQPSCKK